MSFFNFTMIVISVLKISYWFPSHLLETSLYSLHYLTFIIVYKQCDHSCLYTESLIILVWKLPILICNQNEVFHTLAYFKERFVIDWISYACKNSHELTYYLIKSMTATYWHGLFCICCEHIGIMMSDDICQSYIKRLSGDLSYPSCDHSVVSV